MPMCPSVVPQLWTSLGCDPNPELHLSFPTCPLTCLTTMALPLLTIQQPAALRSPSVFGFTMLNGLPSLISHIRGRQIFHEHWLCCSSGRLLAGSPRHATLPASSAAGPAQHTLAAHKMQQIHQAECTGIHTFCQHPPELLEAAP